jgi:hypothetical protein
MRWVRSFWVFYCDVLHRVRRADDLGCAALSLRRPHGETWKETAGAVFELAEGIADVAAGCGVLSQLWKDAWDLSFWKSERWPAYVV